MKIPKGLSNVDYKFGLEKRFDHVFFSGDLNYRCDGDCQEIYNLATNDKYIELLKKDQLSNQIKVFKGWSGYEEQKINFPPTYKFYNGTSDFILEKGKNLGYCDRILYGGRDVHKMKSQNYDSVSEMMWSDHKPVFGQFEIDVPGVDPEKVSFLKLKNRIIK